MVKVANTYYTEEDDTIEVLLHSPYGLLSSPPEGTTVILLTLNNTNLFAMPILADEYMVQLQQNGVRSGNLKDNIYLDFTPTQILLMHKNINILDNLNERDIDIKTALTNARNALSSIRTAFQTMQGATGGTAAQVNIIKAAAGTSAGQLTTFISAIQTAENAIQAKYDLINNLIS